MSKHLKYLRYLCAHKWWVAVAAIRMGFYPWTKPWLWMRILVHDWSKLLPGEWFPYCQSFYGGWKHRPQAIKDSFNLAWAAHIRRNNHHWQHWVLLEDGGGQKLLRMPDQAVLEMICDWAGAGRAISGQWDLFDWYSRNREVIRLNPETRRDVENLIESYWRSI